MVNQSMVNNCNDWNIKVAVVVSLATFIFSPALGCITCILLTFVSNDKKLVPLSFSLLWLLIILIQSQRVIKYGESGDWQNYSEFYSLSRNFSYIFSERGGKDIGFTLWNFLGHLIVGNHFLRFADLTVDLTLFIYSLCAYRIWKLTNTDARYAVCSLCLIFLLPEIMLIANNLLRQQFATALMLYGIVLKNTQSKWWPLFILLGFLNHSMTLVFIPLIFFDLLKKPTKKILMITLICIISFPTIFILLKDFLLSSSLYILQRIGGAQEYFQSDAISPYVIYTFGAVVMAIYFKHFFSKKTINKYIWFGSNTILYITLICVITSSMPLLVTRVYITRLGLLSMFIPYLFIKRDIINNVYQGAIIVFFMIRFVFMTHSDYLDVSKFAIMPLFNLL